MIPHALGIVHNGGSMCAVAHEYIKIPIKKFQAHPKSEAVVKAINGKIV